MVHDGVDVSAGPASLDSVHVRFDERRLVSDAGLLLTTSLADRLGIEDGERVGVVGLPGAGCGAAGSQGVEPHPRDGGRGRTASMT